MSNTQRSCKACTPSKSVKALPPPLIVQCASPIINPPNCVIEPNQVVLAIESGRFYYWGKKLVDDDHDGHPDRCEHCWLEVKCNEPNPISFRQSQIFFRDYSEPTPPSSGALPFAIIKPYIGVNAGRVQPKIGDYIIDQRENKWYLMDETGTWVDQGILFSGLETTQQQLQDHIDDDTIHHVINDFGTSSSDIWSAEKIRAELDDVVATGSAPHFHDASDINAGTFADARIAQSNVTQYNSALIHQSLIGAGTNSHAQIDAHISDATRHRMVNDASTSATDLWSAQKLTSELAGKSSVVHTHAASDVTSGTFANARISQASVTQYNGALVHQSLSGAGSYTHAQIDSHIADPTIHRQINDTGSSATDLWSASKIANELTGKSDVGHVHSASQITDFASAADNRIDLQKGVATGLATLDSNGKIPASQLQLDSVVYAGTWNATTNSPTIANGVGTKGQYYVVGTAGTTTIDGINDWQVGDWIIFNGVAWEKTDHTDQVTSVAGKQGAVTLVAADVTDFQATVTNNTQVLAATAHLANTSNPHSVTKAQVGLGNVENIKSNFIAVVAPTANDDSTLGYSIGSVWINTVTDKNYTCVDATSGSAVWRQGIEDHTQLSNIGTNTHAQIDTHIADATKHRQINDAATGTTDLWSASKITTELATKSNTGHVHAASDVTSGTFADARIAQSSVTQYNAALVHQTLSGAGTNTHAQVDTHIADATKHRQINDSGTSTTELWSASKLNTEFAGKSNVGHAHAASDVTSGTFADARISQSSVTQHNAALIHQSLSGAGTNTHAQIDTHIADATKHRQINDAGTSTTDLWSASQINSQLATKSNIGHTHTASNVTDFDDAVTNNAQVLAATSHISNTSNPHSVTKAQVGLSNVLNIKSNFASSVPPTVTDDSASGYSAGSFWIDITTGRTYQCLDATVGAALWRRLDIVSHTELTNIGSYSHAQIDSHIGDVTIHRSINDLGTATTDLWSASQIISQLATKSNTGHAHAASDVTSGTFADARIASSNVTQHNAALVHQTLSGAGTNTHAQIDTHIADATVHRQINDAGTATTDLWSASKIIDQLATKSAIGHVHAAADVTSGTFADARISQSSVTQHNAALAHQTLSGAGTNTHAQIDSHIADVTKHRTIDDNSTTSSTSLWSALQIATQLASKSAVGHTHTASNITDFSTAADARISVQKGVANGLATLDSSGKIPASQLSLDGVDYQGAWNASTNSPSLASGVGTKGFYYVVTTPGTTTIDTINDWQVNDWIIFNGSVWQKADHSDQVSSVAGKQGAVTLESADLSDFQSAVTNNTQVLAATSHIANTANPHNTTKAQVGLGNVQNTKVNYTATVEPTMTDDSSSGYSVGSVWINVSTAMTYHCLDSTAGAAVWRRLDIVSHTELSEIGSNTHDQIDTHIADATIHRQINDAGTSATDLWSASQISSQLATKSATGHTHAAGDVISGTFADARIAQSSVTQYNSALVHQTLSGAGTNTHAQIDTHIADATRHRQINDAGTATTDLWSASKITTQLATKASTSHVHSTSDITSGTFADARIAQSNVTQYNAALVHQTLSGAGTNTHAQIDTHIADATKHRQINDASTTTTDLWSASKINTQLATKSNTGHTHAAADITSGTLADARIAQSNVTQYNNALVHQSLSGAGTNTHAQIDAHIADNSIHMTTGSQTFAGAKTFATINATTETVGNIAINAASTITFVAATSNQASNSSSVVISVPAGTSRDDFMMCHIAMRDNSPMAIANVPSGWHILRSTSVNNGGIHQYYYAFGKRATANEPATYTWSGISPTSNEIAVAMGTYSGVAAFQVINADAVQATPSSFTHTTPSIVTTVPNTMLVAAFMYASSPISWALVYGLTPQLAIGSPASPGFYGESLFIASGLKETAGGTGTFSAEVENDPDFGITHLIALTPISDGRNIILTSPGAFDIAPKNATAINLGSENAPTFAYDITTRSAIPTDNALTVVASLNQSADIAKIIGGDQSVVSGFNFAGQLFLGGSINNAFRTTIMATMPTANRTWTLQNASDTFVGRETSDQLSNKQFADGSLCHFYDLSDTSNRLYFNINGTGNHDVQIFTESTGSATDNIYIPDTAGATDRFVLENATQTLTKKTLERPIFSQVTGGVDPTPPTQGVKVYCRSRASRESLNHIDSGGFDIALQPALYQKSIGTWYAQGNGTTVSLTGFSNATQGTLTARSCAATNFFTQTRRLGFRTSTTAGTSAGTRHGLAQFWRGNAAFRGGFFYVCRFGMSSAATVSTQRTFVGLTATTSAFGNTNPSSLLNLIGIGNDSGDSEFSIIHNDGSGAATKVALSGGTFDCLSLSTECIEFRLYCAPNTSTVGYSVEILGTSNYTEGTISTDLPANTTFMGTQIWTNNGTALLSAAIDVCYQYMETAYQ